MMRNIDCLMILFSVLLCGYVHGQQLCEGNLGINIFEDGDFGSGTENFVITNPNIAPGYNYNAAAAAPNDGSYVIANNTNSWSSYFNSWIRLTDNSSDPNGYFMLVNADFEPGLFYEQEVDGLCENTLYEFSAEIINVIRSGTSNHILPNISFLLNDVVLFSSGDVPQDEEWHKYGSTFTTDPGQTSVKLSLRNNAPGGNGNDLALDNISFQACGPDAFVNADETIFFCENDNTPTDITADINALNQALQWQFSTDSLTWVDMPGATSDMITHDQFGVGKYYYRYITAGTTVELANEKCRTISDVLIVEVLAQDYTVIDSICVGSSYNFGTQILSSGGDYYEEFISSRGCDSFVNLSLSVYDLNVQLTETICFGETYDLGSQVLASSGLFSETFVTSMGCDSVVEIDLTVLDRETLDLDSLIIDPSCEGFSDGSIQVTVVNGEYGPYSFDLGDGLVDNADFVGLSEGVFNLSIFNAFNCSTEVPISLDDPDPFILTLPADTTIDIGDLVDIAIDINQPFNSLTWDPEDTSPCGDCLAFSFLPPGSQLYTATAINQDGCETSDAIFITIVVNEDDLDIYVPNVFDPTTLQPNDGLLIGTKPGLVRTIKEFSVYDRWGNLVHRSKDFEDLKLWDGRINGKLAMPGVYAYLLEVILVDGNTYNVHGGVTIIR